MQTGHISRFSVTNSSQYNFSEILNIIEKNKQVTQFVDNANQLAKCILNPNKYAEHYHGHWWLTGPTFRDLKKVFDVKPDRLRVTQEKKADNAPMALALSYTMNIFRSMGAVLGIGKELEEVSKFNKFYEQIKVNEKLNVVESDKLDEIVRRSEGIFRRIKTDAQIDLMLGGSLGIGMAFLILGGLGFWQKRTVFALEIITSSCVVAIFYKWILGYTDKKNKEDAKQIKSIVRQISNKSTLIDLNARSPKVIVKTVSINGPKGSTIIHRS